MKTKMYILLFFVFVGFVNAQTVYLIEVNGVINPVSTEFIVKSIDKAEDANAELLVIELDTPGGLMESMHQIVKKILASRVPVAVFVSPPGSRAGSAGVFITMSAHIAAMAPGTNIGSAHPVNLGGGQDTSAVMTDKIVNDAVAHIRSVAEKRGRNADWAESAVRESANITEKEALEKNVIEYVVASVDSLLYAVHGKEVEVLEGTKILDTKNARIERQEMSWRQRVLAVLSNPNIAYILMMIGIYGIIMEFYNPGAILPGVIGGICLILGLYSLQTLPVNFAGVLFIILAVIMFLLEIKVPSYGILSIGGVVSLVLGSILLIDSPIPYMQISWSVIITVTVFSALFFLFVVGMAIRAQKKQPTTGKEGMIGEQGIAIENINKEGRVEVHGETWKAISEERIKKGQRIIVTEAYKNQLLLKVKSIK